MKENSASPPAPGERRGPSRLSRIALPIVLFAGAALFGRVAHAHYPVSQWLFWRYAEYWLCSIIWGATCISAGHAVVKRVLGATLPLQEHLALSFATGVYVFALGMLLGGLFGLYGPVFFVALPLALLLVSGRASSRTARRLYRHLRARRQRATPASFWALPITVFGLLGVGMVYFAILTPENVAFDARWQHLAIAEHYAAEGAVRRFPEGWIVGASPRLASYLYTWAFLLPKSSLFDRIELSSHLEFTAFLFTLLGIPALVRLLLRRLPGGRAPDAPRSLIGLSWVARFLFPGIFLYDSSLCTGADHIAAIFAIPIYTLLLRAYRELSPRLCLLLALMLSSVFITKYTGTVLLLGFPVLAIGARTAWLLVSTGRARLQTPASPVSFAWAAGPALAILGCIVFTAPHWAPSWAFYGDPLYPMFHKVLALRPWTPDSSERFEWGFVERESWRPKRDLTGLWASIKVLFTYSFIPNDWSKFHGKVPVFGSLFTLLMFCLPFVRRARRLWGLFAAVHLGIFCWYWVHHQDRYLQTILPWMAAGTAAAIALAWERGTAARVALAGLIGLQVIWAGDVYFIPGHAMIRSPIQPVVELISSGYRKDFKAREKGFGPYAEIGKILPRGAKVLVHENHVHLGLMAMSVNDFSVNQGGISYGRLGSSREVYELLKGYGVTHLLWSTTESKNTETLAGDLRFFSFASSYGKAPQAFGSLTLAEMPGAPPEEGASDVVLMLSCGDSPAPGLYRVSDLNVPVFGPGKSKYPRPFQAAESGDSGAEELASAADFAVVEARCKKELSGASRDDFKLLAKRKEFHLFARSAKAP